MNEWPKFFVRSLPIVQPIWHQFYFLCCISHCRLYSLLVLCLTIYLMLLNPSAAIILCCFLPNIKLKKKSFLKEEMLFLVWLWRKEKRKIVKLYKARISETWFLLFACLFSLYRASDFGDHSYMKVIIVFTWILKSSLFVIQNTDFHVTNFKCCE